MAKRDDGILHIPGTDGDDVMVGTWDQDTLWGLGGNDVLRGEGGDDTLAGHEGADQLWGGDGRDSLDGGAGDDVSYGGAGEDSLRDPDGGNDRLYGEGGDDELTIDRFRGLGEVLLLSGGEGNDVIRASVGTYNPTASSTVTIDGGSGDDYVFANGLIRASIDLGAGNDRVIISSRGSHTLTLGEGHDVLVLGSEGSTLTINDFAAGDFGDRIDLLDSMSRAGVPGDVEKNPFSPGGGAFLLQIGSDVHVKFGSATIVLKNVQISELTASNFSGADPTGAAGFPGANFFGSEQSEQIWASRGDDRIEGFGGDDSLIGLDGNDEILGGAGNDSLDGGIGNDILHGGDGADRFEEYQGSGGDDAYYGEGGSDVFNLQRPGEEIESITIWGGAGDDYVSNNTGLYGGPVSQLFVDGGDGNDSVGVGNVDSWAVNGGAGSDQLGLGYVYRNSVLFFGEGVFDGGAGEDWVILDENSQGLPIVGVDGSSFRIGNAVMRNVEGIRLGGGGSGLDISSLGQGLKVYAEGGSNTLIGSAYNDVLSGAYDDDKLDGGGGFDIAVFDRAFDQYEIETTGGVTTVRCIGDSAQIYGTDTLTNIERLQFEDGWYTLNGTYVPAVVTGTSGADELVGMSWSDTLIAGDGDDLIFHSAGTDVVDGGGGTDIFYVLDYLPEYFKLLASGDDFLLCGPNGMATLLKNVETLVFVDGATVELNRLYDGDSWVGGHKDEGPLVLPGEHHSPTNPDPGPDLDLRPGLLLRLEAIGGDFDPNAGWGLTLSGHPDWG